MTRSAAIIAIAAALYAVGAYGGAYEGAGEARAAASNAGTNSDMIRTYSVRAAYEDVKRDVEDGVIDAGLKVDYRGDIGKMLKRTGKDVGSAKNIYKHAEFFQFCSARLSRAAMEADPANMAICPYVIFMYESIARPGRVTVGYRRPIGAPGKASKAALDRINALLNAIVKQAAEL